MRSIRAGIIKHCHFGNILPNMGRDTIQNIHQGGYCIVGNDQDANTFFRCEPHFLCGRGNMPHLSCIESRHNYLAPLPETFCVIIHEPTLYCPIGDYIGQAQAFNMKVEIMQAKSPLFSIVIPTRNRSHLLGGALKSALEQDFDDYEVVVVANNCQDNTREVVERLQTDRVKYYETDRTLTMPANWELAWTKTSGKYVTYLPDDDALVPTTLSFLAKNTLKDKPPVISWED